MIKRFLSVILALMLTMSVIPTVFAADESPAVAESTEMAYGTPVIDGEIDNVWSSTNYNIIDIVRETEEDFYRGWFKLMWDEENMYVLAKIYGEEFSNQNESAWENDSLEVFVDELYNKSTKFQIL